MPCSYSRWTLRTVHRFVSLQHVESPQRVRQRRAQVQHISLGASVARVALERGADKCDAAMRALHAATDLQARSPPTLHSWPASVFRMSHVAALPCM